MVKNHHLDLETTFGKIQIKFISATARKLFYMKTVEDKLYLPLKSIRGVMLAEENDDTNRQLFLLNSFNYVYEK